MRISTTIPKNGNETRSVQYKQNIERKTMLSFVSTFPHFSNCIRWYLWISRKYRYWIIFTLMNPIVLTENFVTISGKAIWLSISFVLIITGYVFDSWNFYLNYRKLFLVGPDSNRLHCHNNETLVPKNVGAFSTICTIISP